MYTVSEGTALWTAARLSRVHEKVSKIEVYDEIMDNNYRESVRNCLIQKSKSTVLESAWSRGVPLVSLGTFCFVLPGSKLSVKHLRRRLLEHKDDVSLVTTSYRRGVSVSSVFLL